jgi:glutamine amidotransferase
MTRIALLDYGMGNLHSAAKALEYVGATVDVTNDPKLIAQADKIVFPGVGAMRDCMQGMHEAGIDEVVRQAAFNKPVLAICVGMQALMQHSEENGGTEALGIFEGTVKRFPNMDGLKVPHMGWNQVHQADPSHPMLNRKTAILSLRPVIMAFSSALLFIKKTCSRHSSIQKKVIRLDYNC